MSSYMTKFVNERTGETATVFCYDDYFGQHKYGYAFPDGEVLTADEMLREGWTRNVI